METAAHGAIGQDRPQTLSDRRFGFVAAVWLAAAGLWPLVRGGDLRWWALAGAAIVVGAALLRPRALAPLNRLFQMAAHVVGILVQTAVTFLLFALVFVPLGLATRRGLRKRMGFAWEPGAISYWTIREVAATAPDMRQQF